MSHTILSLDQFAKDLKYTVRVEIEVDDETIATTEIELTPDGNVVNTDDVIEWLGKLERSTLENDVNTRYDEYLESEGYYG